MKPPETYRTFASYSLLALATAVTGCGTKTVEPAVINVGLSDGRPTPEKATVILHMSRDDESPPREDAVVHRLRIDGRFAAWNEAEFVTFFAGSTMLTVAPGQHVYEIVDADDNAIATTGLLETKSGISHFLAVFGAPDALQHRWFANDPAVVPAGSSHIRLLNALKSRDALQPLLCPGGDVAACAAAGPALNHGETFEVDHPADKVAELKWRWNPSAPGGGTPVTYDMTRLYPFQAPCTPGTLMMPVYLGADGSGAWLSIEGTSYLCDGL